MPKQPGTSGFLAKMGSHGRKAHEEHRADETTYSEFGELPAGIENGIAQLVECKVTQIKEGKKNAGEWMFYAAGVVVQPKTVGDIYIAGMRTQISEPLFETPDRSRKSLSDHFDWMYNQLRRLGLDTAELQIEDLESALAALKEDQPYFKFRTWKGEKATTGPYAGKEPMTNHSWEGTRGLENYVGETNDMEGVTEGEATEFVEDAPVEEVASTPPSPPPSPRTQATASKTPPKPAPKPSPKTPPKKQEEPDLDELVASATAGNEESQRILRNKAIEKGLAEDYVDNLETWEDVMKEIIQALPGNETEGGGETSEGTPEANEVTVGMVYKYQRLGKTGKPLTDKAGKILKPIDCEVVKVDPKKGIVDLKNLDDESVVYKGVPFSALIPAV